MKSYRVTYTTPFDPNPIVTEVTLSDKHDNESIEAVERVIRNYFIKQTKLVLTIESNL